MQSTPQSHPTAQTWDANQYAANGRFVADLAGDVIAMLAPQAGEHILDLGCGDGALTEKIAATGAIVTACDADASMLAAASSRGLNTLQADMRFLPFNAEFHALFSNAAIHWVRDQAAVAAGVHRALKPGGRFVAEMGGLGNIAAIRVALASVLKDYSIDAEAEAASRYPSQNEMRSTLEAAGFTVVSMTLVPRPTLVKAGMEQWLRTFRSGVLKKLNPEDEDKVVARTVALLEPALRDNDGVWWADYVRLRFTVLRA